MNNLIRKFIPQPPKANLKNHEVKHEPVNDMLWDSFHD